MPCPVADDEVLAIVVETVTGDVEGVESVDDDKAFPIVVVEVVEDSAVGTGDIAWLDVEGDVANDVVVVVVSSVVVVVEEVVVVSSIVVVVVDEVVVVSSIVVDDVVVVDVVVGKINWDVDNAQGPPHI